jgi:transformation/transcription domain-associated protein
LKSSELIEFEARLFRLTIFYQLFSEKQRESLAAEIVPFVCSGSHVIQKDCQPSALNTFVESLSRCQPGVAIPAPLLKYLGKSHNLWHRAALLLEQQAFDPSPRDIIRPRKDGSAAAAVAAAAAAEVFDFEAASGPSTSAAGSLAASPVQEAMDGLSELYFLLLEEDMWAGLWTRKAKYSETNIAIAYEQQGYFEQAQGAYELAMSKYRADVTSKPAAPTLMQEVRTLFIQNLLTVTF